MAMVSFATMNAKTKILFIAALAAFTAQAAEEREGRVDVGSLPPAVQRALEPWRTEGPLKEVTRQTIDGRTIYSIEIEKNNAPNPRVRVAEDGTLVNSPTPAVNAPGEGVPLATDEYGRSVTPTIPRIDLADLPAAVQQTARTEAAGREIADIDRETWRGRQVYEIEFKQRGLNSRIYVADDGTLVRDERRPGEAFRSVFMGTQLEDTPAPVQTAIRQAAGDREIADIDRETEGGRTVYRVEIRSGEGLQELRIAEDGKTLHDSRAQGGQPRR
jgi:uncharacterized membrane protein YkoI